MVILLIPNLGCQLRCSYCFEGERLVRTTIDVNAMKASLKRLEEVPRLKGSYIAFHGGEPSLVDRGVLADLAQFASQYSKSISFQTNGVIIDDQLIDVISRYNMNVGISLDGPGMLNSLRGPDPNDKLVTRKYTAKVYRNIGRLLDAGVSVGVLSVLHNINVGTDQRLKRFEGWLLKLRDLGVGNIRVNLMYATNEASIQYELNTERAVGAMIALYEFRKMHQLQLNPFMEMIQNLKGASVAPCHYCQCDLFSTHTISIFPDGSVGNCDRTFGSGCYLRSVAQSHPGRYRALKLDQCKDCRYWNVCYGGCPNEGFNGDWRNKTRHCAVIFNLYTWIEKDLVGMFDEVNLDVR